MFAPSPHGYIYRRKKETVDDSPEIFVHFYTLHGEIVDILLFKLIADLLSEKLK
jgi:hypothetical protein